MARKPEQQRFLRIWEKNKNDTRVGLVSPRDSKELEAACVEKVGESEGEYRIRYWISKIRASLNSCLWNSTRKRQKAWTQNLSHKRRGQKKGQKRNILNSGYKLTLGLKINYSYYRNIYYYNFSFTDSIIKKKQKNVCVYVYWMENMWIETTMYDCMVCPFSSINLNRENAKHKIRYILIERLCILSTIWILILGFGRVQYILHKSVYEEGGALGVTRRVSA
jgi:hypothetical protein